MKKRLLTALMAVCLICASLLGGTPAIADYEETEENVEETPAFEPGDCVFFGEYYYQGKQKQPIEWIVLEQRDNAVLLLSKNILDSAPAAEYSSGWKRVIPQWLDYFYGEAFSKKEQKAMIKLDGSQGYVDLMTDDMVQLYWRIPGVLKCGVTPWTAAEDCWWIYSTGVDPHSFLKKGFKTVTTDGRIQETVAGSVVTLHTKKIAGVVISNEYRYSWPACGMRPYIWVRLMYSAGAAELGDAENNTAVIDGTPDATPEPGGSGAG